jgi:hypothetical protein
VTADPPGHNGGPLRLYRAWWPALTSVTGWFGGIALVAADLLRDGALDGGAVPIYAALLAAGTGGALLGGRK